MPMKSKAQAAAMHAAAQGHSTIGIPQSVGKKFVSESHGQNVKKLPEHKKKQDHSDALRRLMMGK